MAPARNGHRSARAKRHREQPSDPEGATLLSANRTERHLRRISDQLVGAREELTLLDAQLVAVRDTADDARTRALASDAPMDVREADAAGEDLRRLQRARDEAAARIADLRATQDQLLEDLCEVRQQT